MSSNIKKPRKRQVIPIEDVLQPYPMKYRTPLCDSYPRVAEYWCYARNCGFGPEEFSAGSQVAPWWICVFDSQHVFQQRIASRVISERESTVYGHGCPFCAGKKVCSSNSLKALHPEVAIEWHPVKNGRLSPADALAGSAQKAWWLCSECRNPWQATVDSRTGSKQEGCPFCAGRRAWAGNNLLDSFPELAKEWHRTKNGGLRPEHLTPFSNKRVWWQCRSERDHVWTAKVNDRATYSTGCPFCTGKLVSRTNSLAVLNRKLAQEWHPTRNGKLQPTDVTSGSHERVWWQCRLSKNHVWQAGVWQRAGGGTGCPFCSGTRVSAATSLAALYPMVAQEWHTGKNGKLRPTQVTTGSSRLVWWRCRADRSHEWVARVKDRSKQGNGCPFCFRISRQSRSD